MLGTREVVDQEVNKRGVIRVICSLLGGVAGLVLGCLFLLEPEKKSELVGDRIGTMHFEEKETGRKEGWYFVFAATGIGGALGYKVGDAVADEVLK